jgi:predicted nucleotide-binding protein
MARRPTQPPLERPNLTVEQKRRCIERLQQRIGELEAFDPQNVQRRWPPEVLIETAIDEALSTAFGHNTVEYKRYTNATRLDHGPVSVVPDYDLGGGTRFSGAQEARKYLAEGKQEAILTLGRAIQALEEEIADQEAVQQASPVPSGPPLPKNKVFVVHGHDEAVLQGVARFLEQLDLEAIILREQPSQGRAIIENFEHYAAQVGFAVVLLTPDDIAVGPSVPPQATRARQNVVFELGYFAGKLGRGRACLMRRGDVEIPSDLHGIIYVDFDEAGGWKIKLVQELKAACLEFDANKMWS